MVYVLERGNHVRDTSKADNTASKQSHHTKTIVSSSHQRVLQSKATSALLRGVVEYNLLGETTRLIADGGHDTLVAVGALNGGGLGSKADEGHAIGIGGDAILSAEASGLGLGRAVCRLRLGRASGMGLLLVDRRGTTLLILDRLSGDLSGGLGAHIAHLVVGAGGLSYGRG